MILGMAVVFPSSHPFGKCLCKIGRLLLMVGFAPPTPRTPHPILMLLFSHLLLIRVRNYRLEYKPVEIGTLPSDGLYKLYNTVPEILGLRIPLMGRKISKQQGRVSLSYVRFSYCDATCKIKNSVDSFISLLAF